MDANLVRMQFNPKRRILAADRRDQPMLDGLVQRVKYVGNPLHKRNPGDFGLTPPSAARPSKSLCDLVGIKKQADALRYLKEGLRRGLVSEGGTAGWPKQIWSRMEDGTVLEAQFNGSGDSYHGYPLPPNDPFAAEVLRRW